MRDRTALLACLALLGGCAASQSEPSCSLRTAAATFDVPTDRSRIFVPVTIGTESVPFMLDTGAENSILSTEAADHLSLRDIGNRERHNGKFVVEGAAGSFMTYPVAVPHLRFANGDLTFGAFLVGPLFGKPLDQAPAYGLLGTDILSNWAFDIDRPHGKLTLFDEDGCRADRPPWSGAVLSEALEPLSSGEYSPLVRFVLTVNGHELTAVLDTGAPSAIRGDAADALGPGDLTGPTLKVTGGGLLTSKSKLRRFDPVVFAGQDIGPLRMLVLPDLNDEANDILLGENFLIRHRVFVSYRQHRIFIDPGAGS